MRISDWRSDVCSSDLADDNSDSPTREEVKAERDAAAAARPQGDGDRHMMRRRIIGRFKRSKQGGWEGEISTLAIQRQIRLVPNDDRVSDRAPSFRVMLGWRHIGDAWERTSHSEPPRE